MFCLVCSRSDTKADDTRLRFCGSSEGTFWSSCEIRCDVWIVGITTQFWWGLIGVMRLNERYLFCLLSALRVTVNEWQYSQGKRKRAAGDSSKVDSLNVRPIRKNTDTYTQAHAHTYIPMFNVNIQHLALAFAAKLILPPLFVWNFRAVMGICHPFFSYFFVNFDTPCSPTQFEFPLLLSFQRGKESWATSLA